MWLVKGFASLILILVLATVAGGADLRLNWTDNSSAETGQDIERCSGANCTAFAKVASVAANVVFYLDPNLAELSIFCYRVRATAGTNVSPYSNTACSPTGLNGPGSSLSVTAQ